MREAMMGRKLFVFMVQSPSAFPAMLHAGLDSCSGRLVCHQTRTRLNLIQTKVCASNIFARELRQVENDGLRLVDN